MWMLFKTISLLYYSYMHSFCISGENLEFLLNIFNSFLGITRIYKNRKVKHLIQRVIEDHDKIKSTNRQTQLRLLKYELYVFILFSIYIIMFNEIMWFILHTHTICVIKVLKSKITKILNSEKNSKRKVQNQMAISNAKTHQTNGQQLSYPLLGTVIFKCGKWWI